MNKRFEMLTNFCTEKARIPFFSHYFRDWWWTRAQTARYPGDPHGFEAPGSVGYGIGGSGSGLTSGTRGWTRVEPTDDLQDDCVSQNCHIGVLAVVWTDPRDAPGVPN
jgi:hypothetical protein